LYLFISWLTDGWRMPSILAMARWDSLNWRTISHMAAALALPSRCRAVLVGLDGFDVGGFPTDDFGVDDELADVDLFLAQVGEDLQLEATQLEHTSALGDRWSRLLVGGGGGL
jgi:hypothetical protein